MGSGVLIWIKKSVVVSTRVCYRSVYNHPFLVGFVCWLYLLYRSFPVLFSLIVSASPVLITTAVLLGTLLSLGESNLPELEDDVNERSERDEGLGADGVDESEVVGRDVGFDARKSRTARDLEDEDSDDEDSERGEVKKDEDSDEESVEDDDNKPLIKGKSGDAKFEKWVGKQVVQVGARSLEVDDDRFGDEGASHEEETAGGLYALVPDVEYERFESQENRLAGDPVDGSCSLNVVYTSLNLSDREEVDDRQTSDSQNDDDYRGSEVGSDEVEDEDGDSSDSESDGNETSSPDASMADIMPMLDELHPLLDVDAPQPAHDEFDSTARRSLDGSSIESAEDSENQDDEDGEDEDGDDGNEEGTQSHRGEGGKPGITWTEDDQKNLMDMGTSELERNLRLENLIARRRARKLMRLADEKNLIDLDVADLPFNVPHISTGRRNPFDSPIDSYDMMGLPPIPGSAPSILLPRRNPFDLPYDQNEEKPILTGDSFAQEFIPPQREAFFRRHESFNVGPSSLGHPRQEMRWKPFFVPERTAAEDAYTSIQRQLSEISESKASSVPETGSVSSSTDHEIRKLTELDILQEAEIVSKDENESDHTEYESQSSEDAESVDVEHSSRDVNQSELEIQLGDHGILQETESNMAVLDELSDHAESGNIEINMRVHAVDVDSEGSSHSSPTAEREIEHDEISLGRVIDDFREADTNVSGSVEITRSEIHLPTEQVDDDSDSSSVTSVSETDEEVLEPIVHSSVGESSISLSVGIPDDHHVKEPVYDSSPTPMEKHLLFASRSADFQPESLEFSSSSVVNELQTPYVDREVVVHSKGQEIGTVTNEGHEETFTVSQLLDQDSLSEHVTVTLHTAPQGGDSVAVEIEPSHEDIKIPYHVQLHDMEVPNDAGQISIAESCSPLQHMSADISLSTSGVEQPSVQTEPVLEFDHNSSSDSEASGEHSVDKEDAIQVEHDEIHSSLHYDNESLIVHASDTGPNASSSDSESMEEDHHLDFRNTLVEQADLQVATSVASAPSAETGSEILASMAVSNDSHETQDPPVQAESSSYGDMSDRTFPEVSVEIPLKSRLIESIKQMSKGGVPSPKLDEFQTPVSARHFDFTSEEVVPNATDMEDVEDEIGDFRDIDEGFPAELDSVGDFSVPNSEKVLAEASNIGSHSSDDIDNANRDLPVFEASSVDTMDLTLHQLDDGIPVEEVILPSLLFGGRAAADTNDVHVSEPDSPVSETKEISPENEDEKLVSRNTDALETSEVVDSSVDVELSVEATHTQEQATDEVLKHRPEDTLPRDLIKKAKSHGSGSDCSSDSSSSDSDSD